MGSVQSAALGQDDYEVRGHLVDAANDGDAIAVAELLARPFTQVNSTYDGDATAIYYAASAGHADVVRLLMACPSVDVNKGDGSWTPFHATLCNAYSEGRIQVIRMLMADPRVRVAEPTDSATGYWAWAWGTGGPLPPVQIGEANDQPCLCGMTGMHFAARYGNEPAMRLLLNDPRTASAVNYKDNSGTTPLQEAVDSHHAGVIRVLVACNEIDVCVTTPHTRRSPDATWYGELDPLSRAVADARAEAHTDVLEALMSTDKFDCYKPSSEGYNAYDVAHDLGRSQAVFSVLSKHARARLLMTVARCQAAKGTAAAAGARAGAGAASRTHGAHGEPAEAAKISGRRAVLSGLPRPALMDLWSLI